VFLLSVSHRQRADCQVFISSVSLSVTERPSFQAVFFCQTLTQNKFTGAHHVLADRSRGGSRYNHVGSGAGRPDAAVPDPGPRSACLQHDATWSRRSPGLRLLADSVMYTLRHQDSQRTGEFQRGQVHRLRHVHYVRHLDCLRTHLLR